MTPGDIVQFNGLPSDLLSEAQRLQLLLDAITDAGLYLLDPKGHVTTWNAGAERLLGYAADDVIGRPFANFFTEEDRKAGEPAWAIAEAERHGRCEGEWWRVRKNGTRFRAMVRLDRLDADGAHVGFAVVARDISERHEAQRALFESERQFQILVNGIVDYAMYMLDPNGIVTSWNTGAERIKGYTADEMLGQHFSRFYTPEDRAAGRPARALAIAERDGRFESEGWRVRKDGGRFWALVTIDAIRDSGGTLIGFAKITRDITERRAAQQAIFDSERQFRLLVNGVADHAIYMLDPNGVISSWNAGAERIKGYAANDVIGRHFSMFFTEADRASGLPLRAMQAAIATGRHEAEGWRIRKDGTLFWASAVLSAIRDEDGALVGFAKVTRDITERRDAQQALDRARAQLAQSQKMDALGKLTAGVAHDFNNLLLIVGGQAELLKKLPPDHPRAVRALEGIETAARRGAVLTRQLLTFSRQQRLNPVIVDLRQRVDAIREMLAGSVGARVRLITQIPADTWLIEVDINELELALVNLAVNARDAMPRGGLVTLSAQNVRVRHGDLEQAIEGEFVALTLADTGGGIPADIMPKIFDPFFTTKQVDKGTGLGLAQVYGFTRQSRGAVTVKSEIDVGTQVTLYLPRARDQAVFATAARSEEVEEGCGHILLVEDNPDVADVSVGMLEQLGYTVRLANDAASGLELIEAGVEFDLVFSDIVMAGALDGVELARKIRELRPGLPVLLATGYSSAAASGSQEFPILRKPYELGELARAIIRLLAARRQADQTNLVRFDHARNRPRPES